MPEALHFKKGVVEPRPYQLQIARSLFEKGNTLVVMPTALGKTFVALMATAMLLAKNPSAKILFLAPTKPLVVQQANRFAESLDVIVEAITGEVPPEKRGEKWLAQVVVSTPQTALADLLTRKFSAKDFSLVVFDEAHRAVGDYAYSFLGRQFSSVSLILALTASPSSDKEKISEIKTNLGIVNVQARNETDEDVASFVKKLHINWEFVDLPQEFKQIKGLLEEMLREPVVALRDAHFLESADLSKISSRVLLEARGKILAAVQHDKGAYQALSAQAKAMNLTHAIGLLESQGVSSLKSFFESLSSRKTKSKAVTAVASDFRTQKIIFFCKQLQQQGVEHPKYSRLASIVSDAVKSNQSVIVFAHYRDTVANVVAVLNALAGVEARALIGKSTSGMSQKEQGSVIEQFRNKSFNVLVASSVGEEGLDIPVVDLVVFFEPVPSEIRSIQRRGRAGRTHTGNVLILVAKGTRDEAFFWISRRKERMMRETIDEMRENNDAQKNLGEY